MSPNLEEVSITALPLLVAAHILLAPLHRLWEIGWDWALSEH